MSIRPQPGPQEEFLMSRADIAVAGGAYFGGKTYGLLLDSIRSIARPGLRGVFFRREMPQITAPGGLWEDARELYRHCGASFVTSPQHVARFPSGSTMTFSHMQYEEDRYSWDGAQVPRIYFDQLEQFTERQFWHLALARNRSGSGIIPCVRASCNPLPEMWLSKLLQWWWNPETGYAIPERSGALRYFLRLDNAAYWGASPADLRAHVPDLPDEEFLPLTVTFIPSTLENNPIGVQLNPHYAARLQSLPLVERERGRSGNWKIKDVPEDGLINLSWWNEKIIPRAVFDAMRETKGLTFKRGWDIAGGVSKGADYTSGVLVAKHSDGRRMVVDVARGKWSPNTRDEMMKAVLKADEKFEAVSYCWKNRTPDMNRNVLAAMAGFPFFLIPEKGSKLYRAQAFAAQVEAGNYYLVEGDWNTPFMVECASFTGEDSDETRKDDQVDSVVLADKMLTQWN